MNKLMTGALMTMAVGASGLLATQQVSADTVTVTGRVNKVKPATKQVDVKSTNDQIVTLHISSNQQRPISETKKNVNYTFTYDSDNGLLKDYHEVRPHKDDKSTGFGNRHLGLWISVLVIVGIYPGWLLV